MRSLRRRPRRRRNGSGRILRREKSRGKSHTSARARGTPVLAAACSPVGRPCVAVGVRRLSRVGCGGLSRVGCGNSVRNSVGNSSHPGRDRRGGERQSPGGGGAEEGAEAGAEVGAEAGAEGAAECKRRGMQRQEVHMQGVQRQGVQRTQLGAEAAGVAGGDYPPLAWFRRRSSGGTGASASRGVATSTSARAACSGMEVQR